MNINDLKKILEHPLVDTIASFIKKFKSSKSYWTVSPIVILFTLREALAWKWGSAIEAYAQKQLDGTDYGWLLTAVEFVFGIGGSLELIVLGVIFFLILTYVKVNSPEKDEIVKVVKEEHSKTHDSIEEIKELIKLHGISENEFLEKYFGKDYAVILQNPQTYHNFTSLLKQTNKTADELLQEREELLKKIESQSFTPKLQAQIDKSFKELRYEDTRDLLDVFLEANVDKEKEIIKAHYIKALTYMEQIRYHEAREEFEKIAPNIDNIDILSDYGSMYYIVGEYAKAIEYYERALKINLATLGRTHPSTATTYNNLGALYQKMGEHEKALEYYEKALAIGEEVLGIEHPETATYYNNLGLLYHQSMGKHEKALEYYEKALAIREEVLGIEHSKTATSYNNLGLLYHQSMGKHEKALEYYEKALAIGEEVLGIEHPEIATYYNNLGLLYQNMGEHEKALEYYEKALAIREEVLGIEHSETATSYNNLALLYEHMGQHKMALEYYEKALVIMSNVFPNGHPHIESIKKNMKGLQS